jgi:hypothetical protein
MKKLWLLVGMIALVLMGCTAAGGDEPEAAEPAATATTGPALVELTTVEVTEISLPTIEANEMEDVVITTVAPAGSVDLSQLTPEPPAEGGELIVQPMPGVPDALSDLVNRASQDLAQLLGIDVSEVTLVRSVAVDWRDGSLGCPQPGMGYIMMISSGYQIVLEAQGREHYYHTRGTDYYVYCEDGRPVEDGDGALPGADE